MTLALLGMLAYHTVKGKGRLADMLGTGILGTGQGAAGTAGGGLGSMLGGVLGGGALSGGLKDLLDRFRQSGQEDKAQSWVAAGPNTPIAPNELEQALGQDRVQWLVEQTGMSKEQLWLASAPRCPKPSTSSLLTAACPPKGKSPNTSPPDRQLLNESVSHPRLETALLDAAALLCIK